MRTSVAVNGHRSMQPRRPQARRWWPLLVCFVLAAALVPAWPAQAALISEEQEIDIGRKAGVQLEAQYGVLNDPEQTARLASIGRRVATVSSRPRLPWTFKILRAREVNAISLPGGFIYATVGLMKFVQSDAELAFVMGHEAGHVAARHHVTMIERSVFMSVIAQLLLGGSSTAYQASQILQFLLQNGFSRENEFEADRLGVLHTHRAGFDASAGLRFMTRLRAEEGRDPGQFEVLLRTHPALGDRIVRVREQLKGLGYRVSAPIEPRPQARPSLAVTQAIAASRL